MRFSWDSQASKVHINFSNLQVIIMIIPEEYFKFQDIYLQNSWMTQKAQSEQQWWVVRDTWWPLGHRSANSAECCEWAWHASIPRNPPRTEIQSSLRATAGLNVYSLLILEIPFTGGNYIRKKKATLIETNVLPQDWAGECGQWLSWCQRCLCSAPGPIKTTNKEMFLLIV